MRKTFKAARDIPRDHVTLNDCKYAAWLFGEGAVTSPCNLTGARLPTSSDRRFNSEIVEFFSGPELRNQPTRLFPATRPGLERPLGIPELRNHFGVRTPCAADMLVALEHTVAELSQSLLKSSFLGRYLACQN
jgi:hypothetical protein